MGIHVKLTDYYMKNNMDGQLKEKRTRHLMAKIY